MKAFWTAFFWLWLTICSWLLLKEAMHTTPPFPHFDKLLHAAGFTLLTFAGLCAFSQRLLILLACMAIYGGASELLQGLLTLTRDASIWDWLADMAGVMLAYGMYQFIHQHKAPLSE